MKTNLKSIALALAFGSLTACLPDDALFTDNGSNSIVELYNLSSNRAASEEYGSRDLSDLDYVTISDTEFEFPVIVNFTGANGTPEDVTIELAIDETIAASVSNGIYTVLPKSAYALPSSNTVTIPKGTNRINYTIKVHASLLSDGQTYALGVKIVSASKGTISKNFSAGAYYFKLPINISL
jgi:hypothetical protein